MYTKTFVCMVFISVFFFFQLFGSETTSQENTAYPSQEKESVFCPILKLLSQRELDTIRKLLIDQNIDHQDQKGKTLLFWTVEMGDLEALKYLIGLGASVNLADKNNVSPLHKAADKGLSEFIKVLCAKGAQVNAKDKSGMTPLHAASISGHADCLQILIENKAQVKIQNNYGRTPLHLAAAKNYFDCIELLINADFQDQESASCTIC